MNDQPDEEPPLAFSPEMLLAKLPVPVPHSANVFAASSDALWSQMELCGTLLAAHAVLSLGRSVAEVAADLRHTPDYLASAFMHLSNALALAVADPAAPYSPHNR